MLLHVKFRAKEFDCSLTRELVQLIDREADLINRYVAAFCMCVPFFVDMPCEGQVVLSSSYMLIHACQACLIKHVATSAVHTCISVTCKSQDLSQTCKCFLVFLLLHAYTFCPGEDRCLENKAGRTFSTSFSVFVMCHNPGLCCCRGRKSSSMEGLRKRICTLFLQFIENPMFNPEAANFFNLSIKTCSTENYMFTGLTASDSATLAAKSLLV